MPYADKNRKREYERQRKRYLRRLDETRDLLRRGQQARHAIQHYGLEPHLGLLYTIWPEQFQEVQEAVREQERTAA